MGVSLAGLRAVETLRADGYMGTITWIGAEPTLPYDRPPLSKQVLRGDWEVERVWLRPPEEYSALNLDLRLGMPVVDLDASERTLGLADGRRLPFDAAIIATGAHPRRLVDLPRLENIFYLRTLEDSLTLRAALQRGQKLTIIGAGFIGLEIASTARARGVEVTIIEMLRAPLVGVLGEHMAGVMEAMHRAHGVDVRCGTRVREVVGQGTVEGVLLESGETIPTDVLVVAAGVVPETGWLETSGMDVADGIVCDRYCRTSIPGIYAAGDVCRWYNPLYGTHMRIEHWTNALEQGGRAAHNLLSGDTEPYASVPYFWSDQYEARIQFAGWAPDFDDVRVVDGAVDEFSFAALYRRGDACVAVLTFSRGRIFTMMRRLLAGGLTWDQAVERVENLHARR